MSFQAKNSSTPLVSVIIAVKNDSEHLLRCLQSLLSQTYTNIEILICDDGSDAVNQLTIENIKDNRITKLRHSTSKGQSAARNTAIKNSKGKYLAIADSDDIFHPDKIEKQVHYLEVYQDIDVVGTGFVTTSGGSWNLYSNDDEIRAQLLVNNPFVHSSVMLRRRSVEIPLYDSAYDRSEDYALFAKQRNNLRFSNLDLPLVTYNLRMHNQESVHDQRQKSRKIRSEILRQEGIILGESDEHIYHGFCELDSKFSLQQVEELIIRILEQNSAAKLPKLNKILYTQFSLFALQNPSQIQISRIFPVVKYYPKNMWMKLRLLAKLLISNV